MPGARLAKFRKGDNAELFAEYILRHLAFVTQVPREEDTGHDLLCSLIIRENKLLKAGPFFTVQVKSSHEPLIFKKDYQINWLSTQENPYFLAIVDLENQKIEIYSTWSMHRAFYLKINGSIKLVPGDPESGDEPIVYPKNKKSTIIYLGKPILSIQKKDILDDEKIYRLSRVFSEWILLDRGNIVRRQAKMYWVFGPKSYTVNKRVESIKIGIWFFVNHNNLKDCIENFVRSSIDLLGTIQSFKDQNINLDKIYLDLKNQLRTLYYDNKKIFLPYNNTLRKFAKLDLLKKIE